jgi:hypothetical protein
MSVFAPLATELDGLLSLQERFEQLRRDALLHKGRGLCDLAYANSYDGPDPHVVAAIREALDSDRALDLQYTPYGGATITRRLIAQQLSRRYAATFHYRDVIMTPGAMAALNIVFRAVRADDVRGGGEVILITPISIDCAPRSVLPPERWCCLNRRTRRASCTRARSSTRSRRCCVRSIHHHFSSAMSATARSAARAWR